VTPPAAPAVTPPAAPAVAPPAAPAPRRPTAAPELVPATVWQLDERDRTLKTAVQRWSATSGWQLRWEVGVDYPIGANASVPGSFEDAVASVIHNMDDADVPMRAIFYRGNKVLRIVARGTE